MSVRVPITVEGNLAEDPALGQTENGKPFARFAVVVNDRRYNEEARAWEDAGEPVFHRATVFGRPAENLAASLRKGDAVLVSGSLEFQSWEDNEGRRRTGTQIIANHVGPSLRYNTVTVNRAAPRQPGPDASATGPVVAAPAAETAGLAR